MWYLWQLCCCSVAVFVVATWQRLSFVYRLVGRTVGEIIIHIKHIKESGSKGDFSICRWLSLDFQFLHLPMLFVVIVIKLFLCCLFLLFYNHCQLLCFIVPHHYCSVIEKIGNEELSATRNCQRFNKFETSVHKAEVKKMWRETFSGYNTSFGFFVETFMLMKFLEILSFDNLDSMRCY